MRTVYSTHGIAGDRTSAWRSVIHSVYAHLEIDVAPSRDFFGRLVRARLGAIEITNVRADSEIARRTDKHIARAATDACIYLLVKEGRLTVEQFGRTCVIGEGQYALLDLDAPYTFSHPERVHKVGLKLPRDLLRRSDAELARHCATPHSAAAGIARLAADYICGLTIEDVDTAGASDQILSRTASDLIFLSLESERPAAFADQSAVRAAIRRRAIVFIEGNCANAELRPETIANGVGVSLRYLHQCFEAAELSVMEQLKKTRLARARAELEDRALRREPINQIAFRNGFRNVCHFSESFKSAFGLTPRQMRDRSN